MSSPTSLVLPNVFSNSKDRYFKDHSRLGNKTKYLKQCKKKQKHQDKVLDRPAELPAEKTKRHLLDSPLRRVLVKMYVFPRLLFSTLIMFFSVCSQHRLFVSPPATHQTISQCIGYE
jgi:hypothetical protein